MVRRRLKERLRFHESVTHLACERVHVCVQVSVWAFLSECGSNCWFYMSTVSKVHAYVLVQVHVCANVCAEMYVCMNCTTLHIDVWM